MNHIGIASVTFVPNMEGFFYCALELEGLLKTTSCLALRLGALKVSMQVHALDVQICLHLYECLIEGLMKFSNLFGFLSPPAKRKHLQRMGNPL